MAPIIEEQRTSDTEILCPHIPPEVTKLAGMTNLPKLTAVSSYSFSHHQNESIRPHGISEILIPTSSGATLTKLKFIKLRN